jgi:hypothetical protein
MTGTRAIHILRYSVTPRTAIEAGRGREGDTSAIALSSGGGPVHLKYSVIAIEIGPRLGGNDGYFDQKSMRTKYA